jgi:hypothetical protein
LYYVWTVEEMANVLVAARELLQQQHFDEVVDACQTALDIVPNHVGFRLLLAESLMSMRRDAEAQSEVAAALKVSPASPDAFRLLGALAFRRDELRAAEVFLRQALRVAPHDHSSELLLEQVKQRKPPAAAAAKLPAASAAAGTSFDHMAPLATLAPPRRRALGTEREPLVERTASLRAERRNVPQPVRARGSSRIDTHLADNTVLDPTPTGSYDLDVDFDANATTGDHQLTTVDAIVPEDGKTNELPRADQGILATATPRKQPWVRPDTYHGEPTRGKGVRVHAPESVALRLGGGHMGFGEYLVMTGSLTRWQLYRVLQVQDWKHMRVGEAAVELGYIKPGRIEALLASYQAVLQVHPLDHEQDTVG